MPRSLSGLTKTAGILGLSLGALVLGLRAQPAAAPPKATFGDVIQVFRAHCTRCHGAGSAAGGLRLDTYDNVMKGGSSGPALAAKNSKGSLLMQRIRGEGGLPQMPIGLTALSAREQAVVSAWIDQGAFATGEATSHWAYVKPIRPRVPRVVNYKWVRNPIDAFVLSRLQREGLKPSPSADKLTLLRRVTLDLTGLPPTLSEIESFLSDKSVHAYEKVVDRLLASPHYGEKMALPWLDAARYADSNGFQQDGDTYQYVWRDWVVRAMNANMPFDRFTILQIAGDLLPGVTRATPDGRDAIIATAFNRNHMLNGEGGAIAEEQRNVGLFDRVDTVSTVWSGLTMACARCHDHKYDPLTQRDYYSMMAYFNNVPETGVPQGGVPYSIGAPWIYAGNKQQMDRLYALESLVPKASEAAKALELDPAILRAQAEWERMGDPAAPKEIQDLLKLPTRNRDQKQKLHIYFMDNVLGSETWKRAKDLNKELSDLRSQLPRVMVMSDRRPRETHILNRGNYEEPLDKVTPTTPDVFPKVLSSKNRIGLAQWMISPENPLTARVQVNRYWQTFFGQGLVKTTENFGVQGSPPSHPELLDWLAVEFRESGWNVKRLHRLIVTSATYQQSSKTSKELLKRDPDNQLLARGPRFRMPSLILRDIALAASGLIDLKIGGKPVYPYQPKGIWSGLQITEERNFTYPQSKGKDLYRRSLYTFWRRTVAPGNMFDAATRQVCTVRESRTSTPLHALTMLNDITWVEAGRAMAERVMTVTSDSRERLKIAFKLTCTRAPNPYELAVLLKSLSKAKQYFTANPKEAEQYLSVGESQRNPKLDKVEHAAYAAVCLSILNLDEAMTKE
ncbi:MAG: PSD1 and planctomycete cytochrome C domain-containing protein [Fimbriimonadaceae bacterium]|nr:PSD1 and planctomycete cytochrome C domain-containing protein [Fimbriimonadaceae bacterium]